MRSPNPVIEISEGDFENVFLRLVGDPAQRYPLRDDFMVDDKRRGRGFPETVNQIFRKPVAIGAPSGFVDSSCWHPSTSRNNASIAAAIDRCRSNHCLGNDCKTGTAAYRRAKLDAMSDAVGRRSDDEQPEPEAIRARRIEPEERLEYARQLIGRDALAGVVNLDANCRAAPAAADEDTPARRCVIECIAREIAQDAVEQHRLAQDHGARRQKSEIDPIAPRRPVEL